MVTNPTLLTLAIQYLKTQLSVWKFTGPFQLVETTSDSISSSTYMGVHSN